MRRRRKRERSALKKPGRRISLRPAVPKVPTAFVVKAAVLNHSCMELTPAGRALFGLIWSQLSLLRPVIELSTPLLQVIGKPLRTMIIELNCQPFTTRSNGEGPVDTLGRS